MSINMALTSKNIDDTISENVVYKSFATIDDAHAEATKCNGILVRASAFSRLLGMLLKFVKDNQTFADIYTNELYDDEEEQMLNDYLEKMSPKLGKVPTTFPLQDTDIIANMILKVIRFNSLHTYLNSKLSMCMLIQFVGSKVYDTDGFLSRKNSRDREMVLLNNKLCDIGKEIEGKTVSVSAENIIVTYHEFNTDSQFIMFYYTIV